MKDKSIEKKIMLIRTDKLWQSSLKVQNLAGKEVCFPRADQRNFKALKPGEKIYFLDSSSGANKYLVSGVGVYLRFDGLVKISDILNKYPYCGYKNQMEICGIIPFEKLLIDELSCIIIENVEFFKEPIPIDKLNIKYPSCIESCKTFDERVGKIIDLMNKTILEINSNEMEKKEVINMIYQTASLSIN